MKLYEISADFAQLYDQLEAIEAIDLEDCPEGCDPVEYKDELREAWFDALDAMEQDFDTKAESTALYIRQLQAEADALDKEARRLQTRSSSRKRQVQRLKDYLLGCMDQMHLAKAGGARATVSVRSTPPSVCVLDEAALICELQQKDRDDALDYKPPSIRKSVVKEILKSGVPLENATITRSQTVQIR